MEDYIPLIIVLFLLSQVSERLGNVIKLHIVDRVIPNVPNDPIREKKKERKVIIVSLISGLLITIGFELMIKEDTAFRDNLQLQLFKSEKEGFIITRYILMTFLLGFGSKFWHDILDLLFYYKKVKQALASSETFKYEDIKQIEESVELQGRELANRCMEQNEAWLDNLKGVNYGVALESINGKIMQTIVIYSEDPTVTGELPNQLTYRSNSGVLYHVPVKVYLTGKAKTQVAHITTAGEAIANKNNHQEKGTFGCLMKDHNHKPVIITCYHVVKTLNLKWEKFEDPGGNDSIIINSTTKREVGKVREGFRNFENDIVIIDPVNIKEVLNYSLGSINIPDKIRKVTSKDAELRTQLFFKGINKPYTRTAYVINECFARDIYYSDSSTPFTIINLIVFSNNKEEPYSNPSQPGDSGAIMYTHNDHEAVGMIVGGDSKFGYAISFYHIINHFHLKPF